MKCTPPIDDARFVLIWQTARTLGEAAAQAGYVGKSAQKVACARARRMRKRGVPLRSFRHGGYPQPEVEKLAWLAERATEPR